MNRSVLALAAWLPPVVASAHAVDGNGFLAGVWHPVFGLDHLLAMLSVGVLSVQIGGRAIWSVPATFVLIMLVGGWLGMQGVRIPLVDDAGRVELGIVISVAALGFLIATGGRLVTGLAMVIVAFFAIFHGYAHGVEMPARADPLYFAAGFSLSTLAIHLIGVVIGLLFTLSARAAALLRYVGAVILGMGLHMIYAVTVGA